MKLKLLGGVAAIAMFAGISNASADIITVTWSGEVQTAVGYPAGSSVTDTNGYFGTAGASLAGQAFTATFVFDSSTSGAVSTSTTIAGGSQLDGTRLPAVPSPLVSAALSINGNSVSFNGQYQNEVFTSSKTGQFQTDTWDSTGNSATNYLTLEFLAQPSGPVAGFPTTLLGNYTYTPGSGVIVGPASIFVRDGERLQLDALSVTVSDTSSVAAVPEPSTWAMMVLGFGGLGFLSYRRTQRKGGVNFRFA
jgi:PEP-CTERM motif